MRRKKHWVKIQNRHARITNNHIAVFFPPILLKRDLSSTITTDNHICHFTNPLWFKTNNKSLWTDMKWTISFFIVFSELFTVQRKGKPFSVGQSAVLNANSKIWQKMFRQLSQTKVGLLKSLPADVFGDVGTTSSKASCPSTSWRKQPKTKSLLEKRYLKFFKRQRLESLDSPFCKMYAAIPFLELNCHHIRIEDFGATPPGERLSQHMFIGIFVYHRNYHKLACRICKSDDMAKLHPRQSNVYWMDLCNLLHVPLFLMMVPWIVSGFQIASNTQMFDRFQFVALRMEQGKNEKLTMPTAICSWTCVRSVLHILQKS